MTYDDLFVLIPGHSLEDFPTELGDRPAEGLLNTWAVLWHPVLLATANSLPRWHRADDPPAFAPNRLILVPPHCDSLVTADWIEHGRSQGVHIVTGQSERGALVAAVLQPLDNPPAVDPDLVADFLAFGHIHWQTEILTRQMRQFGNLDEERLRTDALNAAKAAVAGDPDAARQHLRTCFEQLLEVREQFYPVSCYLMDLCLLIPRLAGDPLVRLLDDNTPVNLLGTVQDFQTILSEQRQVQATVRQRWQDGTLEVVGGEWAERCSPLLPLDAQVHELDRGRQALRHLCGQTPVTWGRRRYGLSPLLPQLLKRSGYTGALHFVMDDGVYPDEEYSKLQWQGPDGSTVPAYSRIPLAGDSASAFLRFPVRLAESMDHDYVAGLVFARWPEMKSPWLEDFRRAHRYAPVLGKFVTFANFFAETDLDGRMSEFRHGSYLSPFLVQSVARREAAPIQRYVQALQRRRQFEAVDWCQAMESLLSSHRVASPAEPSLESLLADAGPDSSDETTHAAEFDQRLAATRQTATESLARTLLQGAPAGRGLLILNPHSFARKTVIDWPVDASVPTPLAPVVARQFSGDVRQVVVELPPCGYAWIPLENADAPLPPPSKTPLAEDLVIRNEHLEISLSPVTGGISQVRSYGRGGNRLSQQLAWRFSREKSITTEVEGEVHTRKTWYSDMVLREHRILAAGPAMGAMETVGDLVDPTNGKLLATYRQTIRLYRGRPYVDIEIELGLEKNPEGDPWTNYLAARFAWSDPGQMVTRSQQQTASPIKDEQRFESPHYIELASEAHRTTILTGGLPFHRLTGDRMLDTLLVTEGEQTRRFRFGLTIDHSYPMEAAADWESPGLTLRVEQGPPRPGPTGWLFQVAARNIQLRRLLPFRGPAAEQNRQGCIVRLQETEGRNKTFRLECFRTPTKAQQVDLDGKPLHTFKVENGGVLVSMAPNELCDVEVRFD
ncbi:MAG: hypothetical protein ACK5Q5_14750 [Planctomycetaceae bacterium]